MWVRTCGIPVYTTQSILNGMNRCYAMTQKIYSVGRPILKDTPFAIRDFTITAAFEVPHDGTDNVGYRIKAGGRCFVFATDLGYIPDRVADYLQQAHCLVLEANYDMAMLQQGPYPYYLKKRIVSRSGHLCNNDTAEFSCHTLPLRPLTHFLVPSQPREQYARTGLPHDRGASQAKRYRRGRRDVLLAPPAPQHGERTVPLPGRRCRAVLQPDAPLLKHAGCSFRCLQVIVF